MGQDVRADISEDEEPLPPTSPSRGAGREVWSPGQTFPNCRKTPEDLPSLPSGHACSVTGHSQHLWAPGLGWRDHSGWDSTAVTLLSRSGRGTRSGHQTAAQSMGQFGEGVREWFEEQVKRSLSPDSTPESASPWTEVREASGMGATLSAKQQGEPATPNGQLHSLPTGS